MQVDRSVRLVIVEDNPADVQILREILDRGRVLNVLEVFDDGPPAIERLLDESQPLPDLMVLDLSLPSMSGLAVLDAVRGDPRTRSMPVVVMSASDRDADVASAYEHGVNSFVTKPADLSTFLDAVSSFERFWMQFVLLPPAGTAIADLPPAPSAPPVGPSAPRTLLVVEDNAGDALLVETYLETHAPEEFEVGFATSLAEARQRLSGGASVDLVLLDLHLPDSSGSDTYTRFLEFAPGTPFVVMTGLDDESTALDALQAGAQDYLVKGAHAGQDVARIVRYALERARSESYMRQAQKIEAMARLAGGVAHDFNNMLQVVRGHAELLGSFFRPDDADPSGLESVRAIEDACTRANELMRQLLAFGSRPITFPREIGVDELIEGTRTIVTGLMGESIALRFELASRGNVRADPVQLEQILLNLALNARHAMGASGTLTLRTWRESGSVRRVRGAPTGDRCVIEVEDDGCGMEPEVLARAFEPFYTTRDAGEGSGLGLSSVYGIVRQLGGMTEIDSTPGVGTRVRLLLPLLDPPARPRPEAAAVRAEESTEVGGAIRMLVVDDEAMIRTMLARMLKRAGIETVIAEDVIEARSLFDAAPDSFDLVLTDIIMPGESGADLYRHVHGARPELPVVFMSGYSDDRLRDIRDLGDRSGFLEKPFTRASLLAALREALGDRWPQEGGTG